MIQIKIITVGILGILGISNIIEIKMNSPDIDIHRPIDSVSIIVPVLNEEQFIKESILSIKSQTIIRKYPEFFDITVVDSGSTDNTIPIIEDLYSKGMINKIIKVPVKGKLTARNSAVASAIGNIIVSADSDTYYPPMWLNSLLKPFNDIHNPEYNNVIGVVGSTYDPTIPGIPTPIRNIAEVVDRYIVNPTQMVGRNSSFMKHSYYMTGKFDESVNQLNFKSMVKEEEQDFGNRLAKLGNVVFLLNACCVHLGGQKIGCRWGTINQENCTNYKIGIERFG